MHVEYENYGDISVISINNPPVNALGHEVREGICNAVQRFNSDANAKIAVIYGIGRTFSAGADIREFGKPIAEPSLNSVIDTVEGSKKPIIALLHGSVLGGGFELALGCHFRIGCDVMRLGLPEVNLGLIPGAGGTQRLPRIIGFENALEVVALGKEIGSKQALKNGLISTSIDSQGKFKDLSVKEAREQYLEAGKKFAQKLINKNLDFQRVSELSVEIKDEEHQVSKRLEFENKVKRQRPGEIAPLVGIKAVEVAVNLPFSEGRKKEREFFIQLMESEQRKSMIHAFFAERQVLKIPELKNGKANSIGKIGIVGAGTMGSGITVACLLSGLTVTLVERNEESLQTAVSRITAILNESVKRQKITEEMKESILSEKLSSSVNFESLADVEMVIEASYEDMAVKQEIFSKLDQVCMKSCILATNTSYLDIDEIAHTTNRPEQVIGLHFFSPAHVMKLLEIIVGEKTVPDVVATGFYFAKKLNKIGVRSGVCEGFIGNRILSTYRKCTDYLVLDGASPYDIDQALEEFGFRMGPYRVADLAGLDIGWANRKRISQNRSPKERYAKFPDQICERNWFGRKSGKGYYVYDENFLNGKPNEEVESIIANERTELGIDSRQISKNEIIDRCLASMINESAKTLAEGIALRPLDIDVVLINGYGFPRWRGGPLFYADMIGLENIKSNIKKYAKEDSYFWQLAPQLEKLLDTGRNFSSLNK